MVASSTRRRVFKTDLDMIGVLPTAPLGCGCMRRHVNNAMGTIGCPSSSLVSTPIVPRRIAKKPASLDKPGWTLAFVASGRHDKLKDCRSRGTFGLVSTIRPKSSLMQSTELRCRNPVLQSEGQRLGQRRETVSVSFHDGIKFISRPCEANLVGMTKGQWSSHASSAEELSAANGWNASADSIESMLGTRGISRRSGAAEPVVSSW